MVGRIVRTIAATLLFSSSALAQSASQPILVAEPLSPTPALPIQAIPFKNQPTYRASSQDRIRAVDRDEEENESLRPESKRKPAAKLGSIPTNESVKGVRLRDDAEDSFNRGTPSRSSKSSSKSTRKRDREGFLERESRWDPVDDERDSDPVRPTSRKKRRESDEDGERNWRDEEADSDHPAKSFSFFGLFHRGEQDPDPIGTDSSFESDRDCDSFISPVSNPFYAEDPRKLTEIKPIIIYQAIPKKNWVYLGGNTLFFGLQGRIGITERFSVVMNKLGLILINPGSDSLADNEVGLTEIWIGPKFTFLKNSESGLIMATGATFQLPIGGSAVYQNTGNFGLVPYLATAKKFGQGSFGEFTVMNTLGYNFGFSSDRSDLFFTQLHLDYDVGSMGKFFPLIELNWTHYTANGIQRPYYNFEFGDMGNVGSTIGARNYLTLALGGRIRFSEGFQFGMAAEFPLVGTKDLNNFRLTTDFIWRY
jgi:hypothetical protein